MIISLTHALLIFDEYHFALITFVSIMPWLTTRIRDSFFKVLRKYQKKTLTFFNALNFTK